MREDSPTAAAGAEERIVPKVWGQEEWLVNQALEAEPSDGKLTGTSVPHGYCLKRLAIRPRAQCSMHRHLVKDETFLVEHGIVHFERRGSCLSSRRGRGSGFLAAHGTGSPTWTSHGQHRF